MLASLSQIRHIYFVAALIPLLLNNVERSASTQKQHSDIYQVRRYIFESRKKPGIPIFGRRSHATLGFIMPSSTTSPCSLRKATLADTTAIADLGAHVYTLTFGHFVPHKDLSAYLDEVYSREATAQEVTNPKKDLIVATDNQDNVIGFALLTRGTTESCLEGLHNTIELQRIYVHPKAHGSGVGKLLVNCVEEMARKEGRVSPSMVGCLGGECQSYENI